MARRRGMVEQVRRGMYLGQRAIGDAQAAQRGRLAKRVVRRSVVRSLFRAMR